MNDPDLKVPRIEHTTYIAVPVERVYETLTAASGWDAWFTQGTSLSAEIGGELTLRWVEFGAGQWTTEDGGPVVDIEPNKRFAFQWHPAGHPTTVSFDLEPRGTGTNVTVREDGYLASSSDLETLVGCSVGWGEALTLLKFYLEHGLKYGAVPDQ
jgi:uncharacterized protein YndB with AHSA1/START domain